MKVLVTGATGFVGASLARRLVSIGEEVHVFTRKTSNLWRLMDVLPKVHQHDVDLRDASGVETCVSDIRPELIFHLATYGGFASQKDSATILDSNLMGTVNLLKACEKTGFGCFVNTGSSSEYGRKMSPMTEIDLLEPLGDYGVAKAAATLYCRSEAIQKDMPVVTLRLFSPYGPWDDPKRLIPYVMSSLLKGETPTLSNPSSVRDYIFIDDVIEAYFAIIDAPIKPGAIYNVGSGRQSSIGEVVSKISSTIGNSINPVWGAREKQRPEPTTWVADIRAVKSHCNWQPATGLDEGLTKTISWMKDNLVSYNN